LKQTANEMLERTTGKQDSGLEPKVPNKQLLLGAIISNKSNVFDLYSLKLFSSIYDPLKPSNGL